MEPTISLEKYEIEEITYSRIVDESDFQSENLQVSVKSGLTEDKKFGKVTLEAKFFDDEKNKKVSARISGYYTINVEEDSEKYIAINGTAILFPYLRSAISMISTLDSQDAVLIPTINVLSILENQEE
ncbi:preprotein translocase, SecB subunit [Streptococcus mitis SK575]|jgi:preprotein translocase subunit secB|uniref:Preprotein translocase, SecB subunit n=2 Tax=Streptococcus TaxID=1301 RepID=I0SWJ4_STRMT|nr:MULTISPECIES: protein-export chaperone SecB [Streptococcus]EID27747.1 preprotein translocase, SecB subunit [Streptococcus mitis SK575]MDU6317728.1 protein-export chaperone SecB [Streptococcus mitis]MDX5015811.1 protein-export chaperone SecB [Streptococcus anginosus]MDX5019890.1 protein-export chaperone SecB [Streptococcus anginosus]